MHAMPNREKLKQYSMGPSIYPFLTSTRIRRAVRLRWTHVDGEWGGGQFHVGVHKQLEHTDVILSSPAKKLAFSATEFHLRIEKRNLEIEGTKNEKLCLKFILI